MKDEMQIKNDIENENLSVRLASGYIIKSTRISISVEQFRSKDAIIIHCFDLATDLNATSVELILNIFQIMRIHLTDKRITVDFM